MYCSTRHAAVIFPILALASLTACGRTIHVRTVDLPTREPLEGMTVDHQRDSFTIAFWMGAWPKSIGGGETDFNGFVTIENVREGDHLVVVGDGYSGYAATTAIPLERMKPKLPAHGSAMGEAMWRERVRATEAAKQLRPGDTIGIPVSRGDARVHRNNDLEAIKNRDSLDTVFMSTSKITDGAIEALTRFPYVRFVELTGTAVTDAGLAKVEELNLFSLDLINNPGISEQAVTELRRKMPEVIVNYYPHESQRKTDDRRRYGLWR